MRGWTRPPVAALLLVLALIAPASAADTGTLSGAVFDGSGQPVADATVRLSGDQLPARRLTQTGTNGIFRFEHLPPGRYDLVLEKDGVGRLTRVAVVEVGRDTQVDVVLGAVQESLTVSAVTPAVDVRSTEVSFNYRSDVLNSLPLDRTYRGLFQLIPGVADNRSQIGPAAGGNRQDNTYVMDGVNITSPGFGYLSTDINQLDVAEVNLRRAGITAEFGRTAGTVTNAVSRSGSNQLSGVARIDWMPESLVGSYALPDALRNAGIRPGTFRDQLLTTDTSAAVGVGGPIVRDRAFFYGSARYFRRTKWDRFNRVGTSLPDEVRSGPELFGKITASPFAADQVNASFRHRPDTVDNATLTSETAPSLATNTDNATRIGAFDWAHFIGGRTSVQISALHLTERNEDTPVRDLGYLPPFNPADLEAMGQFTDPAQANLTVGANQFSNLQNYRRNEVRGTFTRFFDAGRTSHTLKAGAGAEFGEENFNRTANGWGAIVAVTVNGVPALRARYYSPQSPQDGKARTYAVFVQDNLTIGRRTSVNAGLLVNRDEFAQHIAGSGGCPASVPLRGGAAVYESSGDTCTFLRFGFGDEVQPRLGVSYQLREDKGDKVYAHWGRYYNMDQKSSARSLAPIRIFQTQTFFDLDGTMLSTGPLASTTGKLIDPSLEPIYTDEYLIGYASPLGDAYSLDMFFMSRSMHNFIEDVPSRLSGTAPDSGPFVAANLPCESFEACRNADAERTYRAFTVDLRRRLTTRWTTNVSYTWSRFEGNVDLDYATVALFNTSSIIQDGPGTNVEDPNRFGPLMEDRTHVFKAFATFSATGALSLSGYLRVQSGTPWAARGRDVPGAVLNYLEPAGSHRNPTWTNLDLRAAYQLPSAAGVRASLEVRVMNVFDNQTRLSTDSQQYLDLRTTPTPPYIAPYLQPNPWFGTGNAFAPPRRMSVAVSLDF